MKTDSLFYKLFQQAPQLVLELAGLEQASAENYQFRSEEIKEPLNKLIPFMVRQAHHERNQQVTVRPELVEGLIQSFLKQTAFRLDGVLAPPAEKPNLPLVFVEVQFQIDHRFYSRFFCEIFFYLHQNKPLHPWHAVVIYPSRNIESSGDRHYSALLESRQVQRLYLEDLVNKPARQARVRLVQLIAADAKQALQAAQAFIAAIENGTLEADNKAQILEMIETILVYKFPNLSREEIQKMLGYNDISLKQTRFYQDVYAEGQQEGRQEGRQEGEAKLILRQLTRRFGAWGEDTQKRIKSLNIAQLEALGEALLDFSSREDVRKWLEK